MVQYIPLAKPILGIRERYEADKVIKSGKLAQGEQVAKFEDEFSQLILGTESIAVNSGTSGLHLTLLALRISRDDEVIVPSFTFAATANAVVLAGGKPVFAEIDPVTFNIDPNKIEELITKKTKAIIAVHLYGQPADLFRIKEICARYKIILIEDAAQAHLAKIEGTPVGTIGDAGVFSFYPTKNMTSGEGGMVTTRNSELAKRIRLLRNQGMERRYENEIVGLNNRMSDIHAAIGRVQLTRLQKWTLIRQKNAAFLTKNLCGVIVPTIATNVEHVFHQYTIRIIGHDRNRFSDELHKMGVGNGVYYPIPVHKLPAFLTADNLVETNRASSQVLSIPVHPSLSQRNLEKIVNSVNSIAQAGC